MGRKLDSYTDEWGNLVRDEDLVFLSNGSIYRVEYISDDYVNLSQDRNVWLHVPFSKEIPRRLTSNNLKEVEMKPWKDLTPEEKGALLLAYHERKVIEWWYGGGEDFHVDGSSAEKGLSPQWDDMCYYRVKPEPKKPREFWLWVTPQRITKFPYQITRDDVHFLTGDEIIHVREVLE